MQENYEICFCTYFKLIEKFRFNFEIYTEYTAFCVKSGSFAFKIDEGEEKIIKANEVVVCPPNKKFARKIIEPTELCMIKFKSAAAPLFPLSVPVPCDPVRLAFNLKRLEDCFFCSDFKRESLFEHYCKDILFLLGTSNEENEDFKKIRECLEQNYTADISVNRLASGIGYSTAQFINKFKFYYGKTPKAYLLDLRINKAKEFLLKNDKTSKEIGNLCGFADELYFIRLFKKKTGVTPSQFRKQKI